MERERREVSLNFDDRLKHFDEERRRLQNETAVQLREAEERARDAARQRDGLKACLAQEEEKRKEVPILPHCLVLHRMR